MSQVPQQVDPATLATILSHTFNPDTAQREQAERSLSAIERGTSNYCSTLLQITASKEIPLTIKQAAILRLKNVTKEFWSIQTVKNPELIRTLGTAEDEGGDEEDIDEDAVEFDEEGEQMAEASVPPHLIQASVEEKEALEKRISPQDRVIIKQHLFEAIVHESQHVIRIQLLECLHHICKTDFPEQWPTLLPSVMTSLTLQDTSRCYSGLCTLRMLFKKYQFKEPKQRQPLFDLVANTFPALHNIFTAIVDHDAAEAREMVRILCKIFFVSTQLSIPPYIQQHAVCSQWMPLLFKTFEKQLPQEQQPPTAAPDRAALAAKTPLWKSKKWIMRTLEGIYSRYGIPSTMDAKSPNRPFATFFYKTFAQQILSVTMNAFKYKSQGGYITGLVAHKGFEVLDLSCALKELYPLMKPHLQFIIFDCILPSLCLTPTDLQLWKEDPQEFVRRDTDLMSQFTDPRITATNCLLKLIKKRTRDTLQMTLAAITQIFTQYAAAPNASKNYILKEAAMRMFGSLKNLLLSKSTLKTFQASIESVLVQHVFPEFQNPHGFMRARATWVVGKYAKFVYSNPTNHQQAVKLVVTAIQDVELPVKLASCHATSKIISSENGVLEFIKPHLGFLLEQYLTLMDDIGNEEVILTLQLLIEKLDDDVIPFAERLVSKLVALAMTLFRADASDDEAALACMQAIRAINTVLHFVQEKPQIYQVLEPICQPLFDQYLLSADGLEFYEDTMAMITCFTYYGTTITPYMWSVLPRVCQNFLGNGSPGSAWAYEFISDLFTVLDNFISRGNEMFINSKDPPYFQMVAAICKKLVEGKQELEGQYGAKLLETILANSKGKIDWAVPEMVVLLGKRLLKKPKQMEFKLLLIDAIAGAAYYNPKLFVDTLCLSSAPAGFLKNVFNSWLSHLPHIKDVKDQTWAMKWKHWHMSVLGLSSLCLLPVQQLPAMLQSALPQVLVELLVLLREMSEAEAEVAAEEKQNDDEDDDEDDEEAGFDDVDEREDALDAREMAQEATEAQLNAVLERALQYEQDAVDAQNYASPLDDLDPFIIFQQAMQALSAHSSAFHNQWKQHLSVDKRELLQAHITKAEQRVEEQAKQTQQEQQ